MKKAILITIALLTILLIIIFQYKSSSNTGTTYEKISISSGDNVYTYQDKIYIYGRSGIKIYKNTELVLEDKFSFENLYANFSEDKFIIGDKNAQTMRVYNSNGMIYSVTHTGKMFSYAVNKNGYSAIVTKSEDSSYEILVYSNQGDNIFHLTNITYAEGIPISLDLSDSNDLLAVSFLNINGAIMESNVSIYSLSDTDSLNNSVFGAWLKSDQLTGIVKFLNNQNLLILSDKEFSVLSIRDTYGGVQELVKYNFDNKIDFVSFLNTSSFALGYGNKISTTNENSIERGSIIIYNSSGGKSAEFNFEGNISNVFSNKNGIIIANGRLFTGYSNYGKKVFEYHATQDIKSMYFFNSTKRIALATENEVKIFDIEKEVIKLIEDYSDDNTEENTEENIDDKSEEVNEQSTGNDANEQTTEQATEQSIEQTTEQTTN